MATLPTPLSIYLMNGEVVGAVCPDDDRLLLRRVRIAGALGAARLADLRGQLDRGEPIFGHLLDEAPADVMETLLFERFRDNLVAFVSSDDPGAFESLAGVFVDNMQMGHQTARLIDGVCTDSDLAMRIPPGTQVALGSGVGRDEVEQSVLDEASDTLRDVDELLADVPIEPWTGRALVASLLEVGALVDAAALFGGDTVDEPDELLPDDAISALAGGIDAEAEALDEEPSELDEEPSELDEEPTDGTASAEPRPEDMALWLDSGEQLLEEDLAFFEDHENDRGAGGGGFSTETHNLDRVSVGPEVADDDDVIEAGEVPAAKFSAPVLSEADALEKIEVCNDVLRRVAAAFDAAEGPGRGRVAVQLLVDGSPSKFTALLHDLTVGAEGDLPPEEILDNLASRPPSEHRQLINSALKNVIERALSSAADELPDDAFDVVYESVAGYNQRLGL